MCRLVWDGPYEGNSLIGCVVGDGCRNYGSEAVAKSACAEAGERCGGVISGSSAHWEIRRSPTPTNSETHTSFIKIPCAPVKEALTSEFVNAAQLEDDSSARMGLQFENRSVVHGSRLKHDHGKNQSDHENNRSKNSEDPQIRGKCGAGRKDGQTEGDLYTLDLKRHPNARCLDGSPGTYYFLPGNCSTFVVHMPEGGECTDWMPCMMRSKTFLGSSVGLPQKHSFGFFGSLADTFEMRNMALANSTMVRIPYCSGDWFSGRTAQPSDATFGLWFSGYSIMEAVLEELINVHGMAHAKLVVWHGSSAGAVGSILSLDHAAETLRAAGSKARVVGAPLAGVVALVADPFVGPGSFPSMRLDNSSVRRYAKLWNSSVPKRCAAAHNGSEWLCVLGCYSAQTLKTEIMFFQAQTDSYAVTVHGGVPGGPPLFDPAVNGFVRHWGDRNRKLFRSIARKGVGVFHPACWTHALFDGILLGGLTYQQAFAQFLEGPPHNQTLVLQDSCTTVACNPSCWR